VKAITMAVLGVVHMWFALPMLPGWIWKEAKGEHYDSTRKTPRSHRGNAEYPGDKLGGMVSPLPHFFAGRKSIAFPAERRSMGQKNSVNEYRASIKDR
jgi:hypothetical protein